MKTSARDMREQMMRFQGRRILITGGASGIGLESARILLAEGARVVLLDRDGAALSQAAAELGAAASTARADVTDAAAVRPAVDEAARVLGGIDGLINSAGVSLWKPFEELSFEDWRQFQAIDLDGTFLLSRYDGAAFARGGGRQRGEPCLWRGHAAAAGPVGLLRGKGGGGDADEGDGAGTREIRHPRERGGARSDPHANAGTHAAPRAGSRRRRGTILRPGRHASLRPRR